MALSGCAAVSWSSPAFYAGPTVVPIEELTGQGASTAVAAGFQETVGLGQYAMVGHEWDCLDVGAVELGGFVPNGSPPGMLQLGVKLGTLNGLVGAVVAFDCLDSANAGACEGGGFKHAIIGGSFDVQALISYFGALAGPQNKGKLKDGNGNALPRGGL
jgi:hypothetical protein